LSISPSFFVNSFGLFKNPIIKPANKEPNASSPKAHPSVPVRPVRCLLMIGPPYGRFHPVKKSYPESRVAFCEFVLWRPLRIMASMVTRWIQDKNLNFLRKHIGVLPQKSNSKKEVFTLYFRFTIFLPLSLILI
jgi:hypothetical protein